MNLSAGFAAAVIATVALLSIRCSGEHLHFDRVLLVDYHVLPSGATNYLFRTPKPVHNKTFEYAKLIELAQRRLTADALPPLQFPVYVIDVNLLNTCLSDDRHDIEREEEFFSENTDLGEVFVWPLMGNHVDPRLLKNDTLADMLQYYDEQPDQLATRTQTLHDMLRTQYGNTTNTSTIVINHCQSGLDRTGEMMASYVMAFKNFSFPQAVEWDNSIADGKAMHQRDENEAAWYCFYLTMVKGYVGLNCQGSIAPPPTSPPPPPPTPAPQNVTHEQMK